MPNDAVEKRLDALNEEMTIVKAKLDELASRFAELEASPARASRVAVPPSAAPDAATPAQLPNMDSDHIWSWVGKSSLLPRIATVCFILVFALILRTLTDNGFIGKQFGSYLGMAYAAFLIALGWRLLSKRSRLATVFPVCGTLLMYSVTLETYARFDSVSSFTAYAILLILLMVITVVSIKFELAQLNSLGIFGTCVVAAVIDFPMPDFAQLVFLLLAGNILAYISAYRLKGCEWNRWAVFALTICVWWLWAFRLSSSLARGEVPLEYLSHAWYLPGVFVFSIMFMAITMGRAVKNKKMNFFDLALPTLNGLWAYPLALIVVQAGSGHSTWLGIVGVLLAALHFGFAAFLFKSKDIVGAAICGFTFAGGALLVLAFPAASGSILFSLPVWAIVAYGLARMSEACEIGGIRLTSYILQILACVVGVMTGCFALNTPMPFSAIVVAGVVASCSGLQYKWCRSNLLACSIGFFAKFDRDDRSAVVLLIASLVNGYYMLQLLSYLMLAGLMAEPGNAFMGAQSLLINIGAISLMTHAMIKRNKEILGTAVFVIVIGALKVFGYDLFKSHGVPLVMSVFSFGAVAVVGSIAMSKWSNLNQPVKPV